MKNLDLCNLENEDNVKVIRMCKLDLEDLAKINKLAIEDFKNKSINNFDSEDILIIVREFIRLYNDYDALMKYVKTNEKDTMTEFLIENYNLNKEEK